jgi:hypothetical protein
LAGRRDDFPGESSLQRRAVIADAVYVPDWFLELLEGFVALMDRLTLADTLLLLVAATVVVPFVVLIHEAGHALAAWTLRQRVAELTVGDDQSVLTVRVGEFRLRLGAITGQGDVAGYVAYDGLGAGAAKTFVIALAGPLASLAGAVGTGALAAWFWPHAGLSLILGLATLGGLICCVGNLRVSGHDPASWSDGVWVRAAWRVMRQTTTPVTAATMPDPRQASSTPPPRNRSTA